MAIGEYQVAHTWTSNNTDYNFWNIKTATGTGADNMLIGYGPESLGPCDLAGHVVTEWAEYLDGVVAGYCDVCKGRVTSRRSPGGLPVLRLKAAIELLLGDSGSAVGAMELVEIQEALEAERAALDEAVALLETARRVVECRE